MSRLVATIVLSTALVSLAASSARADLDHLHEPLMAIELLIPDLRLEVPWQDDDPRLVLSLPLAVHAGAVGDRFRIGFTHFAEAQYQVEGRNVRGLVGERFMFGGKTDGGVQPIVEVAGLLGSDGSGAVVGAGLGYGAVDDGFFIGAVARAVVTDQERRSDFALDVQLPFR